MSTFTLPDLGEGLQEAEIVSWHVAEGDHVTADQPLVSVETDKAVVEVPSPQSGIIETLFGAVGEMVAVGAPLATFMEHEKEDAGGIVGEVNGQHAPPTDREAPHAALAGGNGGAGIKATPQVRALARKAGLDLSIVEPTGPNGTITREDLDRALKALADSGPGEPLRGTRRAMAEKMARSGEEVVPATVTEEADIGDWTEGEITMLRIIRAIVAGFKAEPALNVWYDGAKLERHHNEALDLGIAMDTPDGLFVPVIQDAHGKDKETIAAELAALKAGVADRSLPPEAFRGATMTLSNYGPMGGLFSQMVVIPPQVAIIGVGRKVERVVALVGNPAVRPVLPLSLTFDHRALTGGEVVRFLMAMKEDLERSG